MVCSGCASTMFDDCRYCPQCGQPTPLADHAGTAHAESETENAGQSRALTRYVPPSALTTALPETIQAALTQANLCRIRAHWDDAIEYCIEVLRAQPGNQTAHALLGDIYRDQNKLDDAIQWYRMAVDLRPNPTDEAKLQQSEERRARLAQSSAPRFTGKGLAVALNADGSVVGGTTNLMGVSPRRWLNGLTILSVAFTVVMVCLLVGMKYARPAKPPVTQTTAALPKPMPSAASSPLPPATVAPPALSSANINKSHRAGSGFLPDNSILREAPKSAGSSPLPGWEAKSASSKPLNLPPAPVLSVKPLPSPPKAEPEAASEERPRVATTRPESGSMALAEGMRLAKMHRDTTTGAVSLLITSPLPAAAALDVTAREKIVRNVYRAARAFFAANEGSRIVVYVQAGQDANRGGPTLLLAEIDRTAAQLHNPDTDPLERLESGLLSLRVADSAQAAGTPTPPPGNLILSSGDA
jgi:hypothetical protein